MLTPRNILRKCPAPLLHLGIEILGKCSLNVLKFWEGALQKEDFIHRLQEVLQCQRPAHRAALLRKLSEDGARSVIVETVGTEYVALLCQPEPARPRKRQT